GGGVHVADGDHTRNRRGPMEGWRVWHWLAGPPARRAARGARRKVPQHPPNLIPGLGGIPSVGPVRPGGPRRAGGEDDGGAFGGEDVGAFGHEVDAGEDDVFGADGADALGGELAELEAVAGEVGELDDLVLLVVVAEDDEVFADLGLARGDGGAEL